VPAPPPPPPQPSVEAILAELALPALGTEDVQHAGFVRLDVPLVERLLAVTWLATAFRAAIDRRCVRDLPEMR
jgi:hypothetical protein